MVEKSKFRVLLEGMFGQAEVVVIYRVLAEFMGSATGGLFLSQVGYWQKIKDAQTGTPKSWFYKSYEEWNQEIWLSDYEVKKHTAKLVELGVLETQVRKRPDGVPTVHYRFDYDAFESILDLDQTPGSGRDASLKISDSDPANLQGRPLKISDSYNETKTTAKTTAKTTKAGTPGTRPRMSPEFAHSPGYDGFDLGGEEKDALDPDASWALEKSRQLAKALYSRGWITCTPKVDRWISHFLKLIKVPTITPKLVDEVLEWYIGELDNPGEFLPVVNAAVSFREKFPNIRKQMMYASNGSNQTHGTRKDGFDVLREQRARLKREEEKSDAENNCT